MGKQVADFHPAFAVALEPPMRTVNSRDVVELGRLHFNAEALTMFLVQPGLGVKTIDLGNTPIHIEENNAPGLSVKMGRPGGQRPLHFCPAPLCQQDIQGNRTKTNGTALEHLASSLGP